METLKKIGKNLYERVFVAKKTTLIGLIVIPAIDVVIQTLLESQNNIVHTVAAVLSMIFIAYKGQVKTPAGP